MELRPKLVEAVPCVMMVVMEACTVGLTIMASTAMGRGMSPFVFVVYSNAISSLILLPHSFTFQTDRTQVSPFKPSLLIRLFFLGLTGICFGQNLAFVGLSYSSPILACAMGNLLPAFSFILAIILRTVKFEWTGAGSQAKLIGTLISLTGAVSVSLYKGPLIKKHSESSLSHQLQVTPPIFLFSSAHENWLLGSILLAAASLSLSVWNIIQMRTIKQYPEVMTVVSFYSIIGTVQSAVVAMVMETNASAWRLELNMDLCVIVLAAIFGSVIRSRVQMWCMRLKGGLYVPLFKPMGVPIASTCGFLFFSDSFHYGSMMGAFIVGMGYYTVMWGQVREDDEEKHNNLANGSMGSSSKKVPLLQEEEEVPV